MAATDEQLLEWYTAAEKRHAHIKDSEERQRLIDHTFRTIQREVDVERIGLPRLAKDERVALLESAHLEVFDRWPAWPETDIEQELYDAQVDDLFYRLCLAAREQSAPFAVRVKLYTQRIARRWGWQ